MDIGIQEIFLISVIALVILGPERLPEAARTIALWISRFKRSFNQMKNSIAEELNAHEIREQIHNENILHELGESRDILEKMAQDFQSDIENESLHNCQDNTENNPENNPENGTQDTPPSPQ